MSIDARLRQNSTYVLNEGASRQTLEPIASMETDSLFYRLFEEKPKLLFELLGEKPPRTTYSFGAHELKQTSLRTDGVLKPRSAKRPIFFLEAQGYPDRHKNSTLASSPKSSSIFGSMPHPMTGEP
ncbi:MAG: DUF2887 domain-containing protein [Alkalinema sp. RU_4_3]|nr:DUF2887 domain-containing protein [Alkalinema sp. RU_4_3]